MAEGIFQKNKEVEFRVLGEECLILLPEKGNFFKLNKVGTKIWQLVNGKNSKKDIVKKLMEEFEVEEKVAEKDTEKFLNELLKKELIVKK